MSQKLKINSISIQAPNAHLATIEALVQSQGKQPLKRKLKVSNSQSNLNRARIARENYASADSCTEEDEK